MGDKEYHVVMFSRELALQDRQTQDKAVKALWDLVAHKKGLKKKGKEHKLAEDFAVHFTGQIELYRQYAVAEKILFQPEVFRGFLSPEEREEIEGMTFDVMTVSV